MELPKTLKKLCGCFMTLKHRWKLYVQPHPCRDIRAEVGHRWVRRVPAHGRALSY